MEATVKTIIAGSRGIAEYRHVAFACQESGFDITEVVSGGARGVDRLGEQWARAVHLPCTVFPADWDRHGKAAGFIRNEEMARYADALIAIWDGKSRGTADMIARAKAHGLPVCTMSPRWP